MAAYLQRLLASAAPDRVALLSLVPVVRSSSPVFEQDQLLALDAGATPSVDLPPPHPHAEIEAPPALDTRPAFHRPAAPVPSPPVPVPVPAARPAKAEHSSDPPTAAIPPLDPPATPLLRVPGRQAKTAEEILTPVLPSETAQNDSAPAPTRRSQPPFTEPGDAALSAPEPASTRAVPPIEPADPQKAAGREQPAPGPEQLEEQAQSLSDPSQPSEERPRIELSPRPRPEPYEDLPPTEPRAEQAAPLPPTITIGHFTVEIIGEPKPQAAPSRPLTAASASVIGPLGQAQAARRLIALRRL
jgi:hypothetical protein